MWKSVAGLNQGYPVLAWQPEDGGTPEGGPLNPATNTVWRSDPSTGLLTGVAVWDAVPNADSYTVILWDYWSVETDYGAECGLKPIKTVTDFNTTEYDFTSDIQANGTSWYYFTVTPVAAAGSPYESGKVPATEDEAYELIDLRSDAGCYRYFDRLAQATDLQWRGSNAYWSFVDNAFGYLVLVYRVDENNVASSIAGLSLIHI